MEDQYTTGTSASGSRTGSGETYSNPDRDSNIPGAAPRSRAEYGEGRPNFGSARSDYGDLAYGGLNREGLGGRSVDDFSTGRRDVASRGYERLDRERNRETGGGGNFWMLLGGIGIGAVLMYLLDPNQGRRRRALLRDQLVSATNKANKQIGKKARHLQNRAKGVVAEAKSTLKDAQSKIGIGPESETASGSQGTQETRGATAG